jgi:acetolactate synthase-1/2/3 large subunit
MHLNNALLRSKRLRAVSMLHEQGAAIAAEAYARTSGKFGACMVTSGPGATNAITGLAGAWFESTPVIVLSGQVKRADLKGSSGLRQLGTQELDIVSMVSSITKYAVCLTDPAKARYEIEKALFSMRSGRPGPVWLDIPLDVQATEIDPATQARFHPEDETAANTEPIGPAVEQVAQWLEQAQRPVLLVGNGVHCAGAESELLCLMEQLKIPTQTTWIAADLVEHVHPLYFGRPGTVAGRGANFTIQNSDLVIAIGCRMDFSITGFNRKQFARAADIVVIDIDPAEIDKLGDMPDLRVVSDAKVFIAQLSQAVAGRSLPDYSPWIARCTEWKKKYPVVLPAYYQQTGYVSTYVFTEVLCEELEGADMLRA